MSDVILINTGLCCFKLYVLTIHGTEAAKSKTGGVAYEVILKPAVTELDAARVLSPPKDKVLTQDDIIKKLQKAEERRQVVAVLFIAVSKCCVMSWLAK